MVHYDDTLTLRDARRQYFEDNHFGLDGGYNDGWVKTSVGPFPVAFPNTAARVRAVRFHDLHHLVTDYPTTNAGESQIAAWEIATGCADHYAAWGLNLTAMGMGLGIAPVAVFRAFVRGRHSRNLYRSTFDEALLDRHVGELRHELGLDRPAPSPSVSDVTAFAAWSVAALAVMAPMGVITPALGLGFAIMARLTPDPAR